MSFPNQTSLQTTIQQLKEIVTTLQGDNHEAANLVRQMEALVAEIERKARSNTKAVAPGQAPATKIASKPPAAAQVIV